MTQYADHCHFTQGFYVSPKRIRFDYQTDKGHPPKTLKYGDKDWYLHGFSKVSADMSSAWYNLKDDRIYV